MFFLSAAMFLCINSLFRLFLELLILCRRRESLVHSLSEGNHGRRVGAMGCSPPFGDKARSFVRAATLNDGQLNAALNNARPDGIAS
jgi:hypothetical protein